MSEGVYGECIPESALTWLRGALSKDPRPSGRGTSRRVPVVVTESTAAAAPAGKNRKARRRATAAAAKLQGPKKAAASTSDGSAAGGTPDTSSVLKAPSSSTQRGSCCPHRRDFRMPSESDIAWFVAALEDHVDLELPLQRGAGEAFSKARKDRSGFDASVVHGCRLRVMAHLRKRQRGISESLSRQKAVEDEAWKTVLLRVLD